MILERILATRRAEIEALRLRGEELAARAAAAPPPRGFGSALRAGDRVAVIAEFKRRSPSAGTLAPGADAAAFAAAYETGGAAALSVLTDAPAFGGSLADLTAARAATRLPVLRKDFLLDPLQLLESRAAGADAVLLIARLLDGTRLGELLRETHRLGMEALVEVHDGSELERALAAGAEIVGVNARDLATFAVDPRPAAALLRRIPSDRIAVAESGIGTPSDVRRVAAAGARAALVGTRLMGEDPAAAVASLTGVPRGPAVKVCGIRRAADAEAAGRAGADYLGFVFAPGPRRVAPEEAGRLASAGGRLRVGVFVDARVADVAAARERAGIEIAQLHGGETPETCLGVRASGLPVWKAIRPRARDEMSELARRYAGAVDGLLAEGWSAAAAGGTGTRLPLEWWEELRAAAGDAALILAGGLTTDTVGAAVAATRPDVVDVSGGVESSPGVKDPARIRAFVTAARSLG